MHRPSFLLIAGLAWACAIAAEAEAQETCPQGRISRISIDNHSIFDPATLPEEGRLTWAYRLANAVHMRTREDFIADELLFREGQCFDAREVNESARILREFRFIAHAEAEAELQPDGSRHVTVDTRDEWTTKLALRVQFDDGVSFEGGELVEENFLGRGIMLGVFRIDRNERRESGATVEVPRLRGTGVDMRLMGSRTRAGGGFEQLLVLPFQGEIGRRAFRQHARRSRDLFAYDVPPENGGEPGLSHVVVPLLVEQMELSGAWRFGRPGRFFLAGGGASYERVAAGERDEVAGVRGGDFSDREPAASELADRVAPQLDSRRAARLNIVLGFRQLRFETRRGLDALDGVQDLPVGTQILASIGRSVWGSGAEEPGDLFSRVDLLRGNATPRAITLLQASTEGRLVDDHGSLDEWKDLLLEAHGFVYILPPTRLQQTVVLRGAVGAGWRTTGPFQLTLGGPDGVRGYSSHEMPGGRRAVMTVENRVRVPSPFPDFADLGFTVFGDLGRMWKGDAPLGVDSGWLGTLGVGARVGFPSGTSSVVRVDVGFPVGPGASSRSPVLMISAREWVGVLGGLRSPQVDRSRRSGIRGEYIGVARDPGAW